MKLVKITCIKIHTSDGKKIRGDEMPMSQEEYIKLTSVRPGSLEIIGDAPKTRKSHAKTKLKN